MPRIRSLKPEAPQHRRVGRLSDRGFRLWIGGITRADDEGRFLVDLGELRLLIFGYQEATTTADVGGALNEIASFGLLLLYVADAMLLAEFPSWKDHQKIDRPRPSKLPSSQQGTVVASVAEAERLLQDHSSSPRRTLDESSTSPRETPPGIGSDPGSDLEGIGSEGSPRGTVPAPDGALREAARKSRSDGKGALDQVSENGFGRFWQTYPRKKAKQDALKAWRRFAPDAQLQARILSALQEQIASDDWRRDGGKFIPYAATWLNGRRWEDEADRPLKSLGQRLWEEGQRLKEEEAQHGRG